MGIFRKQDDVGQVSQPEGDGPVTLEDRTAPGGEGSPDTNQGKSEPLTPTPDHPQPLAVPDLSDMSPGAGDAQAPSHAAAAASSPGGSYAGSTPGAPPRDLTGPGVEPDQTRPEIDPTTSTGRDKGPVMPTQHTTGEAHRVGGLNGATPAGESIETDTEAGATRMGDRPMPGDTAVDGHGDTGTSPATGDGPALGTSETQPAVDVRIPRGE